MSDGSDERNPFSALTVGLMVAVGVIAFGLVLVLSAYAPDLRTGQDGRGHALSKSAVGYAGLVQLMRETDLPLQVSRTMEGRNGVVSLEVFTPEFETPVLELENGDKDPETREGLGGDKLVPSIYSGTVLVILPKWRTQPDSSGQDRVRKLGPIDIGSYTDDLKALPGTAALARDTGTAEVRLRGVSAPFIGRSFAVGRMEGLQTVSGKGVFPLIVDQRGRAVLAQLQREDGEAGESEAYILSDPDLFNNMGLKSLDRARFADAAIRGVRRGEGPVAFDLTVNGFGSDERSLLKLAFQPPFLAATLCALAAALLAGWQAAIRFGPTLRPERALAFGKGALADNAAGLIRLAGRQHRFGGPYAALVREQAADAAGLARDLSPEAKTAALDRLRRGEPFSALATAAEGVRDPAALLAAARNLYRWRVEMTRGR